jgi:hypothetical protein
LACENANEFGIENSGFLVVFTFFSLIQKRGFSLLGHGILGSRNLAG